jgi:predicted ATP-grasp superfamily ATP-dependent carboligase
MDSLLNSRTYKVLIIDGGARQCLPIIKEFHKKGCEVTALCGSKMDVGYHYKYTDRKILVEFDFHNEDVSYKPILEEVSTGRYDIVIPMVDFFATILSKHKEELSQYATIYVNDWNIYSKAIDKLQTMTICMENGIPCPKTALVTSVDDFDDKGWEYPIVIKPRTSFGAKGFNVANSREELVEHFKLTEAKFGPSLIQEYVPQDDKQYQVEMLMDDKGECKAFVLMDKVRWYPLTGGSSTLNITLHDADIRNSCIKLLKCAGWKGYASLDVIRDPRDGIAKIMEINPRMNGTAKICFIAGVDLCKLILQDAFEDKVEDQTEYKDDVRLRYFHMDMLWFLKSKDRFKTKPSWFSNQNTVDEIFEWCDLRPAFFYTLTSFTKLLHDKDSRSI